MKNNELILSTAFTFIIFFFSPLFLKSQSFIPSDIGSLKLWLASDSGVVLNNGLVAQWNDLSGNNYHAAQPTAGMHPVLIDSALCNKSVIRFDGVDDWLYANFGQGFAQPNTFFAVWRIIDTTGTAQVCYSSTQGLGRRDLKWENNAVNIYAGTNLGYAKAVPFNFIISSAIYNNTSSRIYENGLLKVSGNAGNQNIFDLFLGKGGWGSEGFLKGDIAEIIFYNDLLHDTSRVKVEQYLLNKYSPNVNAGIDVQNTNFCETVLTAQACSGSYLWSTGETTPTITVNQSGSYWVMSADMFGYLSIDTVNVSYPNNQINDTIICFGDTINVSTNLQSPYAFLWSTGQTTPDIDIYNAGMYWVKITDTLGCFIADTFFVNIDSLAYLAGFGADTLFVCEGTSIGLASGTNLVTSYMWSNASTDSILYVYSTGNYCVTISNDNGCSAELCVFVQVVPAPDVNFYYSDSLCINFPIAFSDSSIAAPGDPIVLWLWEFGDSTYSPMQNSFHIYTTSGNHFVSLTVKTQNGCITTHTDTLFIAMVCVTGIEEQNNTNIEVYPNPVKGNATLIFSPPKAQNIQISVYDMLGQEILFLNHNADAGSNNIQINTHTFEQGFYVLSVRDESGGTRAIKFVK